MAEARRLRRRDNQRLRDSLEHRWRQLMDTRHHCCGSDGLVSLGSRHRPHKRSLLSLRHRGGHHGGHRCPRGVTDRNTAVRCSPRTAAERHRRGNSQSRRGHGLVAAAGQWPASHHIPRRIQAFNGCGLADGQFRRTDSERDGFCDDSERPGCRHVVSVPCPPGDGAGGQRLRRRIELGQDTRRNGAAGRADKSPSDAGHHCRRDMGVVVGSRHSRRHDHRLHDPVLQQLDRPRGRHMDDVQRRRVGKHVGFDHGACQRNKLRRAGCGSHHRRHGWLRCPLGTGERGRSLDAVRQGGRCGQRGRYEPRRLWSGQL